MPRPVLFCRLTLARAMWKLSCDLNDVWAWATDGYMPRPWAGFNIWACRNWNVTERAWRPDWRPFTAEEAERLIEEAKRRRG